MTPITPDQQQVEAAAERFAAKLRDFHAGLPADEQAALRLILGYDAATAAGVDEDVAGYAFSGLVSAPGEEPDWTNWCKTMERTRWPFLTQLPRPSA